MISIDRDGDIALVTVNNPPVNALGQALRQGLWDAVGTLDADPSIRAVVLICAGRTFIAGADVTEFGKPPVPPHLPDLVNRLEQATKPWIAAIHGSALGGGFEVAMGFRFRVALDTASVGLPEVTLGIVPGASGTVRTPRLAGVEAAVDLVTTGRPVKATKALSLGLVDAVVQGDLRAEAVDRGLANLRNIFDGAVKRGKLTEAQAKARMEGVTAGSDYALLSDTDLVIEAVFEDLSVKRAVFAQLGQTCRADAILATNTSYLDPRLIAEGLPNQDRFIGLHFFSPANVMKLLEIVPTPATSPETLATGFALARQLAKIPVQAGICDGFIGNRILKRYRAEAETLVRHGTPIAAIDTAMRAHGFAMGPFEAQDLGGLDIAFLQREGARAAGQDVPETLGDILVRAGRKGQKTGGGWYDYAPGDRTPKPSDITASLLADRITAGPTLTPTEVATRLTQAMATEGKAILAEGIALKPSDIDLVEVHGYGYPRWRGGPMFAAG